MPAANPPLSGTKGIIAFGAGRMPDQPRNRPWTIFLARARQSAIFKANAIQFALTSCFLIFTLIGDCHFGRVVVCFIEPWLERSLPLAVCQLLVNAFNLCWPDESKRLVGSTASIIYLVAACVGWIGNFVVAGLLVYEGLMLGSPYLYIHIPRFILCLGEIICTTTLLILAVRQFSRLRSSGLRLLP